MARCRGAESRKKIEIPTRMLEMLLEIPVWPKEAAVIEMTRRHKVRSGNIPVDCPVGEYEGYITWPTEKSKAEYFKRKGVDYETYQGNGGQFSAVLG